MRELGKNSPVAARIKKLGGDRAYRREEGCFVCEGVKLLQEAYLRSAAVETILSLPGVALPEFPRETELFTVSESLMAALSPVKTPQGVLFVCPIPERKAVLKGKRHLVLDGLQDPGNVGTVLRTAEAFGLDAVILTGQSADPYNPKCVRATMGAIFGDLFFEARRQDVPALFQGRRLYAAAADGETDLSCAQLDNCGVIIGSEAAGVSPQLRTAAQMGLRIPMQGRSESLNAAVAAAVIMWQMCR